MPKFYGQNKKYRDPRYFLNEVIEEAPEGEAEMARAKALAKSAMDRQSSGEIPPWESETEPEATPDNTVLSADDIEVLKSIHKHFELSKYSGGGNRAERFAEIMGKLGIELPTQEYDTFTDHAAAYIDDRQE